MLFYEKNSFEKVDRLRDQFLIRAMKKRNILTHIINRNRWMSAGNEQRKEKQAEQIQAHRRLLRLGMTARNDIVRGKGGNCELAEGNYEILRKERHWTAPTQAGRTLNKLMSGMQGNQLMKRATRLGWSEELNLKDKHGKRPTSDELIRKVEFEREGKMDCQGERKRSYTRGKRGQTEGEGRKWRDLRRWMQCTRMMSHVRLKGK